MTSWRRAEPVVYLALLLAANYYLCRDLFTSEFTGHTNSIQGLWIGMARLAGEHWFRPAWWPYQDAGVPFEHTYMPLVPATAALVAKLAHVSAARGLNIVMGLALCCGPATLFVLVWRLTGSAGASFLACLAYSLTSPARALLPETDLNPIRYWSSLRIYGAVVWDDLPHHTAMCFLPIALLFLWRALERKRRVDCALAVLFIALTALASVFGVTALLLGSVCLLTAFPRKELRQNTILVATIGLAAYLVVSPFLPPSLIATIRANQQRFAEDQWSARSLTALALTIFSCVVLLRAADGRRIGLQGRFFGLFALVSAAIPLFDAYLNRHFVPQPNRYTAEMEIGVAMVATPALAWCARRIPRRIGIALAAFLVCVAVEHLAGLRRFVASNTQPVDMSSGIESRIARWIDDHFPGQRVMVAGSIAQWFNVFSSTPQLSGASYSTTPNWSQQDAMNRILTSIEPAETAEAVLWAKAFGLQALMACGPASPQFWKGNSSTKFDGLLPVLWRAEDTTIYRVPQRSPSLAHVVSAAALARRGSRGNMAIDSLRGYVAALDDPATPIADAQWQGFRRLSIHANLGEDQVVSVQTGFHRGWSARANGRPARVTRDGLGFLVIRPDCRGACAIELNYDGGWEYMACRAASVLTILGIGVFAAGARRKLGSWLQS